MDRLFSLLTRPGAVLRTPASKGTIGPARRRILDSTRVTADDVANWFYADVMANWNPLRLVEQQTGSMRLPDKLLFIEWRMPAEIHLSRGDGQNASTMEDGASAILVERFAAEDIGGLNTPFPAGTHEVLIWRGFEGSPTLPLSGTGLKGMLPVDYNGKILQEPRMVPGDDIDGVPDRTLQKYFRTMVMGAQVGLLAIALMNREHVEMETHRSGARSSNKKVRAAGIEFHTIKLPALPSSPVDEPQVLGRHMPLHRVRGHWVRRGETLYWRRAHNRGSAEYGITITDYEVGRPPEAGPVR